jgi:hypothetical protein
MGRFTTPAVSSYHISATQMFLNSNSDFNGDYKMFSLDEAGGHTCLNCLTHLLETLALYKNGLFLGRF